jgi:hypothetical protein
MNELLKPQEIAKFHLHVSPTMANINRPSTSGPPPSQASSSTSSSTDVCIFEEWNRIQSMDIRPTMPGYDMFNKMGVNKTVEECIDLNTSHTCVTWCLTQNLFISLGLDSVKLVQLFSQLLLSEITLKFTAWHKYGTSLWGIPTNSRKPISYNDKIGYKLYFSSNLDEFIKENRYSYSSGTSVRTWIEDIILPEPKAIFEDFDGALLQKKNSGYKTLQTRSFFLNAIHQCPDDAARFNQFRFACIDYMMKNCCRFNRVQKGRIWSSRKDTIEFVRVNRKEI